MCPDLSGHAEASVKGHAAKKDIPMLIHQVLLKAKTLQIIIKRTMNGVKRNIVAFGKTVD